MTQGKLYQKAKLIHCLVPTNETEDNKFVPFTDILDEAKTDVFNSACQNCSYGCTASPGEKNCIYHQLQKWFGESP